MYNVCCQSGTMDSQFVKEAIQFTDKSVLKSFFKREFDPCSTMSVVRSNPKLTHTKQIPKNTFTYFARDLIWKLGRWKKSKELENFIKKIQIDIIYLPIYSSIYMCDFQKYLINRVNVPIVGHVSDDEYGYQKCATPLANLYRFFIRKKLRKLIRQCSYLEVFAENMQKEYEQIFHKKCYLIGKGVDVAKDDLNPVEKIDVTDKPIKFLYTGNIGCERYKVLCEIAKAIDNCCRDKDVVLEVYSATELTKQMKKEFGKCKSMFFGGKITYEEVVKKQSEADLLVHVESFSDCGISSAKMSFSTKIIDYMLARKPIFAVGPEEVNSISFLKNKNIAVVVTKKTDIENKIANIISGDIDLAVCVNRALAYVKDERDIKKIQTGILSRMESVIQNENPSDKCSI